MANSGLYKDKKKEEGKKGRQIGGLFCLKHSICAGLENIRMTTT